MDSTVLHSRRQRERVGSDIIWDIFKQRKEFLIYIILYSSIFFFLFFCSRVFIFLIFFCVGTLFLFFFVFQSFACAILLPFLIWRTRTVFRISVDLKLLVDCWGLSKIECFLCFCIFRFGFDLGWKRFKLYFASYVGSEFVFMSIETRKFLVFNVHIHSHLTFVFYSVVWGCIWLNSARVTVFFGILIWFLIWSIDE